MILDQVTARPGLVEASSGDEARATLLLRRLTRRDGMGARLRELGAATGNFDRGIEARSKRWRAESANGGARGNSEGDRGDPDLERLTSRVTLAW